MSLQGHNTVVVEYTIRGATIADAEAIQRHRRAMFADMQYTDAAALDAMSAHFLPWVRRKMEAGEYMAWLAISPDGEVRAGLGLWLMDWPPHMLGPGTPRANILNVYTEREYRRHGIARDLMLAAIEWCRAHQIRTVILHASPAGRPLYESLGFEATNEMRLAFDAKGTG